MSASLRRAYTLIAPFYDAVLAAAGTGLRAASLAQLPRQGGLDVLVSGIGSGLDVPHLPPDHRYVGLDLTAAMLARARPRGNGRHLHLVQGDSMALPFADTCFDHVVLHLILAIVPDATACLRETARVLKPGGSVLILDKFLRPGEAAPFRRALNRLSRHVVTRLDVVFEEVLAAVPELRLEHDAPVLAGGWFRSIRLVKG
ncbi:class I SAM-dependent methyltransferase [Nitrosovibrio sp. Nv17]|jgi:ubiquinone/menaquinone biosynthesis C-methylase UbiE|uniref:class I SAM-dependent methyltransferase n=1 Tax=Nitrosovibrio sp. Nv17 TaxID=1855339 RepID=UPI0009084FAF|nr:class I SAM-dependent methyltransferase [Nitrosovibrio sp. Nv17]SFW10665.1 Methyltransferase domain-containing protein [Nitrosovibrio sp. Nv17]